MKLGISTASLFNKAETVQAPALFQSMGVDTAELFLNTFSEYEPAYISAIKEQADGNGLSIYSVHPMSVQFEAQLFSSHGGQKADAMALYKKVLEAGQRLGASHYTMHGALQLIGDPGTTRNHRLQKLADTLDELTDVAAERGIQLCLENVSWCFYKTPEMGLALREKLGAGKLKFVLDIKQAVRCGQNPFAFMEAVGEDIETVHLCDYVHGEDGLKLKMPGEGEFDFVRMKEVLEQKGSPCAAFIEVYSDMYADFSELERCYKNLKKVLA